MSKGDKLDEIAMENIIAGDEDDRAGSGGGGGGRDEEEEGEDVGGESQSRAVLMEALMELPLASRLREGELPAICAALESCGFDDPDTLADPFAAKELTVPRLKDALFLFLGGRAPPQSRRSRGAKARAPGLAIQLRRALSDHFRWKI